MSTYIRTYVDSQHIAYKSLKLLGFLASQAYLERAEKEKCSLEKTSFLAAYLLQLWLRSWLQYITKNDFSAQRTFYSMVRKTTFLVCSKSKNFSSGIMLIQLNQCHLCSHWSPLYSPRIISPARSAHFASDGRSKNSQSCCSCSCYFFCCSCCHIFSDILIF